MSRWCIAASLVFVAACSSESSEAAPPKKIEQTPAPAPDRTPPPPQPVDPPAGVASGFFLDSDDVDYQPQPAKVKRRTARPIDLVLRSTPPGAQAAIDGVTIGTTPTFWQGQTDGISHEFTFVKEGYAIARYRFVPTQSGVVHGSLDPLVADTPDAGPTAANP